MMNMNQKIRIGICGYGNLGRGVEAEIGKRPDMELAAVFTRRTPAESLKINANVPVVHIDQADEWKDRIDVMLLCGGSANDLPEQGPSFAARFNTVDSFDTHAKIPAYFDAMDKAAKAGGKIGIISIGWDPGLFSLMRLYLSAIIPDGKSYTFWGTGVSQGHSQAIRDIKGVTGAIAYTNPVPAALEQIKNGESPELRAGEMHTRLCYVSIADGADEERIRNEIQSMPNYFDAYDTTVRFIPLEELKANHAALPHGGKVVRGGTTGEDHRQLMEFSLTLDSNPEFTASVLLTYARAAHRLAQKGESGARTIFDIPPSCLLDIDLQDAVKQLM